MSSSKLIVVPGQCYTKLATLYLTEEDLENVRHLIKSMDLESSISVNAFSGGHDNWKVEELLQITNYLCRRHIQLNKKLKKEK